MKKLQCVRANWWERSRREAKVMSQPRDKGKVPGASSYEGRRRGPTPTAGRARCLVDEREGGNPRGCRGRWGGCVQELLLSQCEEQDHLLRVR